MMNFVSISLLVTLEMVKFIQAQFISWDNIIFDTEKGQETKVQSSNLNEELGMIHYIFSDKTGTLT
jgi:phospholipid-transporting ATPase